MIIGFIEIAGLALIMVYGTRFMMRAQFWLFVLGMLGFIVAAITLVTTSRSSFISSYNSYAQPFTHKADTYHYFIDKAQKGGTNVSTAHRLAQHHRGLRGDHRLRRVGLVLHEPRR